MTTSIYARPEFSGKTVTEIQQVMRDIYATHRVSGLILLVVQAVIMSGLVQIYLATCQPDILTLSVLTAASGLLGGWLGWLCLVNVVYPNLIRKRMQG
jgi:hypothetical protein